MPRLCVVMTLALLAASSPLTLTGCELLSGGQSGQLDDILQRQETVFIRLQMQAQHRTAALRELEKLKQRWREARGDEPLPTIPPRTPTPPPAIALPDRAALGMDKKLEAARQNEQELARLQRIADEAERLSAEAAAIKAALPAP